MMLSRFPAAELTVLALESHLLIVETELPLLAEGRLPLLLALSLPLLLALSLLLLLLSSLAPSASLPAVRASELVPGSLSLSSDLVPPGKAIDSLSIIVVLGML